MSPSSMTAMRSASVRAVVRSCVTYTAVSSASTSARSSRSDWRVGTSSAERGSSSRNASGRTSSARQRGGSGGGGSELTDRAEEPLARFDRLRAEFTGTAEVEETVMTGRVVGREGELATVETPAGRVRALASDAAVPEADAVQVSVRADAVTLHDPADVPATDATSARNRFAGEAVARVVVDVDADAPLAALVTMDSVEKLALRPGAGVVASFKATATRATPG
ncbi:molybdenum-binding protein [halophilic archaeon]|nr:molybdenum-binding protein [halophilic archaeon]